MRRLLMGIVLVLVLVGVCATLEQSVSPDRTATQTETIVTEAVNEFKDILQGMADEFKSIFFSSEGKGQGICQTEGDGNNTQPCGGDHPETSRSRRYSE